MLILQFFFHIWYFSFVVAVTMPHVWRPQQSCHKCVIPAGWLKTDLYRRSWHKCDAVGPVLEYYSSSGAREIPVVTSDTYAVKICSVCCNKKVGSMYLLLTEYKVWYLVECPRIAYKIWNSCCFMHHLGILYIILRTVSEKCCSLKIKATNGNWVRNC